MFGYIYMTTNLVNQHRYIGQKTASTFLGHKYLGSGEALQLAIDKYGKENFKVELIEECESRHELNLREAYWISKYNAVHDESFYNMKEGGHGGSVKGRVHHTDEHKSYMSIRMSGKNNPNYGKHTCYLTEEGRKKKSLQNSGKNNPNYGKCPTRETRDAISQKAKGRVWINNGVTTKHVQPEMLEHYLSSGWKTGRSL